LHTETLTLLLQLFALLALAKILAEIAQRINLPTVVGEIFAGILLGPSLLGSIPALSEFNFSPSASGGSYLEVISLIGAMLLLLITGLETDLILIKHHLKSAVSTAVGGLVLPFLFGFIFSLYIPDHLLIDPDKRIIFSLFIATALSVSAIPVIAKVLIDLKLIRRDIGQITIAVGMLDDTAAWILLSIVLGLIEFGVVTTQNILISILKVFSFLIVSYFLGKWIASKVISFAQNSIKSDYKFLTIILLFTFGFSAIAQLLKLEAVLGALLTGIIFSRIPAIPEETINKIEGFTFGIFAPIFFAASGLKVSLKPLLDPQLLIIGLGLVIVATFSKIAGGYIGARYFAKKDHWTALSFGAGLNARGAIQIIIATIGLSMGILSQEIYSLIIITAVITSLTSPIMLKWTLSHVKPEASEIKRLEMEEHLKDNILAKVHRVIMPVRRRAFDHTISNKLIEARILERLGRKSQLSVTLLTISNETEKNDCQDYLNNLSGFFTKFSVNKKVVVSNNTLESILEEVKKDYDLLIVGATERNNNSEILFNPIVDNLLRLAPCASMVVQSGNVSEDWEPKKILVPTNGSLASKRAAELAFGIVSSEDDEVHILNVIEEKQVFSALNVEGSVMERRLTIAHQIVTELKKLGESLNIKTFTEIEIGEEIDRVILRTAAEKNFDLIILGTDVRPGTDKLYLGPRVEKILNDCSCPVAVFNTQ